MNAPPTSAQAGGGGNDASASPYVSYLVLGSRFDVTSQYQIVKPIGHGAYGLVVSAINTLTGDKVAIKKIGKVFANLTETKRTLREVRLLRHFRHANILAILDVIPPPNVRAFDDVYIVTELMSTDLHQIIASQQQLTDDHCQYFIYQLLRGLVYLHSLNVIHRDLKPSNVLLNANCKQTILSAAAA